MRPKVFPDSGADLNTDTNAQAKSNSDPPQTSCETNHRIAYLQRTAFSHRPHLFKPTHARLGSNVDSREKPNHGGFGLGLGPDGEWRSRDHRKGRHRHPQELTSGQKVMRVFKPGMMNLAWWIAFSFTIGSIVWCINGFYVFLPFLRPSLAVNTDAIGWTGWLGATIFFFAAWPEVFEALMREDAPHYSWDPSSSSRATVNDSSNPQQPYSVDSRDDVDKEKASHKGEMKSRRVLGLNLSRFRELGFIASFIQGWAATIFWISGFTGLPQVQRSIESNSPLLNGVFWTPQVIGGSGFVISAALFMLEAQHRWYKPNVTDLGWQVGFWNLVGGAGFTLCACFGYSTTHWRLYQSALSTFWGSFAFLIGSVLQWWESVNPR